MENIKRIKNLSFLDIEFMEAIYPNNIHVPYLHQLMLKSNERTGKPLMIGEIGCLLSHRKIWRLIAKESDPTKHFLILESDSIIRDPDYLNQQFYIAEANFDMFFWGSWEGHTKLFRSTKFQQERKYSIGTAFIKTTYCTYGYSLNVRAAKLLLKSTSNISYPVDQFKRFISQDALRIGAVLPEVVSGNTLGSTIRGKRNRWVNNMFLLILDIKNHIICYFK